MSVTQNNHGESFTILSKVGDKCVIRFDGTGFTRECLYHNLKAGKVRDYYAVSRYAIGYLGEFDKRLPYWKQAKQLWNNMLKRCYTDDPKGYKWKGTTVDSRWHSFANFLEDVSKLKNFEGWLLKSPPYNLDKDMQENSCNIYSKYTCSFQLESLNKSEGGKARKEDYRRNKQ